MKRSWLDIAIEGLEAEKRVIDLAIAKLREQASKPARSRKAKPEKVAQMPERAS